MDFVASINETFKKIEPYAKHIVIALAAVVIVAGGSWGYGHYKHSTNRAAHAALVKAISYYNGRIFKGDDDSERFNINEVIFKTEDEKWRKVVDVFANAYESHSSASMAPIFLVYQSEALIQLGNLNEAMKVTKRAIDLMPHDAFRKLYEVKYALMQMDAGSAAEKQAGLAVLQALATDSQSAVHDLALYQLGNYFFAQKDFLQARNYWNQLTHKYGRTKEQTGREYPSEWAARAMQQLKLIEAR